MGTARLAAGRSELEEYPIDIVTCADHVREVTRRLAEFGRLIRKAIDEAESAGDQDTMDVFIEISRDIDKWLWFVEAHEQASR
jgi:starvation-inducible DNA-binding protein